MEIRELVYKAIKKRERILIANILYFVVFMFIIDDELYEHYNDLKIKNTFKKELIYTDSLIFTGSGGQTGTNWLVSYKIKGVIKTIKRGINYNKNSDTQYILNSPLRKTYAYLYFDNFWEKKITFILIRILYIPISLLMIFAFRKQHKKVKQLAPYGVDGNYEPLPKPEEKINYNKYD